MAPFTEQEMDTLNKAMPNVISLAELGNEDISFEFGDQADGEVENSQKAIDIVKLIMKRHGCKFKD